MDDRIFFIPAGEWLRAPEGAAGGAVICCRARLARNLAGCRFTARAADDEREAMLERIARAVADSAFARPVRWHDLRRIAPVERRMLVERHLVSREFADADSPRAVAFDAGERVSLMVMEEDHLRVQGFRGGLGLREALAEAEAVEGELARRLDFAFDARFGYLTGCPTNAGTGLRVSAMLHLPALSAIRHGEKAFRAVQELRLAVRGLYGEGTQAHGDLYQISNQATLGRSEDDILGDLEAVILPLADYERRARERMVERERRRLEDMVWRAWTTLANARLLASEEAMKHLSMVRLGRILGWLPAMPAGAWGRWFLNSQPAHLAAAAAGGREVDGAADASVRDGLRADRFRAWLSGKDM